MSLNKETKPKHFCKIDVRFNKKKLFGVLLLGEQTSHLKIFKYWPSKQDKTLKELSYFFMLLSWLKVSYIKDTIR